MREQTQGVELQVSQTYTTDQDPAAMMGGDQHPDPQGGPRVRPL